MPSITRRGLLRTCAAAAAVGAGCGEQQSPEKPPTTMREEPRTPADAETKRLRYDGEPLVRSSQNEADDQPRSFFLIATADERESLRYGQRPDGWREIRRFVDGTNLSESAVLIVQESIGECYRRRLVRARKTDDHLDLEFCEQLRPATVACDSEQRVLEVLAIRLPFAFEEPPGGYSIGGSRGCPFGLTTEGQG